MNKEPLTGAELGIALMEFIATLEGTPVQGVLAALSVVTATIACEAGFEEEEAVYAFRKSFGEAKSRLEKLKKELN
jgi:hypothetical protein